jgi:hypothetical protein
VAKRPRRPLPLVAVGLPFLSVALAALLGERAPPGSGDTLVVVVAIVSAAMAAIALFAVAVLFFVLTSPGRTKRAVKIIREMRRDHGRGS